MIRIALVLFFFASPLSCSKPKKCDVSSVQPKNFIKERWKQKVEANPDFQLEKERRETKRFEEEQQRLQEEEIARKKLLKKQARDKKAKKLTAAANALMNEIMCAR